MKISVNVSLFILNLLMMGSKASKNIVGYYLGASSDITDINPDQLSHIFYAFVVLHDDATFTFESDTLPRVLNAVKTLPSLRERNPSLKLLFSVISQDQSFSLVSADETLRKTFAKNAIELIKTYDYNGLDIDWEFPPSDDKENFILLLKEVKGAFVKYDYQLTAAVRAFPSSDGYNVPEMVKYLDLMNIMTYDFYGGWSVHTGQNAPLYNSSKDSSYERTYLSVAAGAQLWQDAGAPKDIMNIGLAFYGRSFTLTDASKHGVHDPVKGAGSPDPSPLFKTICKNYASWTEVWDHETKNPYKYSGDQWLGYDNKRSIIEKVKYVNDQGYAGVSIWQLSGDDIDGDCGTKWELLTAINENIN